MSKADAKALARLGLTPMGSGGSALLGFQDRVRGGTSGIGIGLDDGLTARSTSVLSQGQLDQIGSSRTWRASLNKILSKLGDTYIARMRKVVARYGAYKTGRFYSSFKQIRYDDHGAGFNTAVGIINDATDKYGRQYAVYVHPKGTPRDRTILKTDLKPLAKQMRADLATDVRPLLAQMAKARILGGPRTTK